MAWKKIVLGSGTSSQFIKGDGSFDSSTSTAVSYTAGEDFFIVKDDSVYSVVDSNINYKRMKTATVSKSGTITVRWTAYIQSGSYWWGWLIAKNNSSNTDLEAPLNILSLVAGGNASASYNSGLDSGNTASVHNYRDYDVDVKGLEPGDQIELWMRSSNSGGGQVTGNGQPLYAKNFYLKSESPTVEEYPYFTGNATFAGSVSGTYGIFSGYTQGGSLRIPSTTNYHEIWNSGDELKIYANQNSVIRATTSNVYIDKPATFSGDVSTSAIYRNTRGSYEFMMYGSGTTLVFENDASNAGNVLFKPNVDFLNGIDVTGNATFGGTVLGSAGTASLPSFAFSGDPNTGMYNDGSNDNLKFSTGGVDRAFLSATQWNVTGNLVAGGNVSGVAGTFSDIVQITSSTPSLLVLNPTASSWGGIKFLYGGAKKGYAVYNSGNMYFGGESGIGTIIQSGGGNGLQFSATSPYNATFAGKVGIGVAPSNNLTIRTDANEEGLSIDYYVSNVLNRSIDIYMNSSGKGIIQKASAGGADNDLAINPNGGNVGIGTTSPASTSQLHIEADRGEIRIKGTNDSNSDEIAHLILEASTDRRAGITIEGDSNDIQAFIGRPYDSANTLVFETDATERMRIDATGESTFTSTGTSVELATTTGGIYGVRTGSNIKGYAYYFSGTSGNIKKNDGTNFLSFSSDLSATFAGQLNVQSTTTSAIGTGAVARFKGGIEINSENTGTSGNIDALYFRKGHTLGANVGLYDLGAIRSFTSNGFAGGLDFYTGKSLGSGAYGATLALKLDESQNATFAGNVTTDHIYANSGNSYDIGQAGTMFNRGYFLELTGYTSISGGTISGTTGTFSGDVDINTGNLFIDSGRNLYLDGGSNTYIKELSADVMTFTTGGTQRLAINTTGATFAGTLNILSSAVTALNVDSSNASLVVPIGGAAQTNYSDIQLISNGGNGEFFKAGTGYTSWGGAKALNIYNSDGVIAFHPSATANVLKLTSTTAIFGGDITTANHLTLNGDNKHIYMTRSATNKSKGLLWSTASAMWFAGLRETSDEDLHIYNYAKGADILTFANTTGNATFAGNVNLASGKSVVIAGTGGNLQLGDSNTGNGSPSILFAGTNTQYNWALRQNDVTGGDFTLRRSASGGGMIWDSTPTLAFSSAKNATFAGEVFLNGSTERTWQSQYNVLQVDNGLALASDTGMKGIWWNIYDNSAGAKKFAEGTGKYGARIYFSTGDGSLYFQHTSATGNADAAATLATVLTLTKAGNATFGGTVTSGDVTINGSTNYSQLTIRGGSTESGIRFKNASGNTEGWVYGNSYAVGFLDEGGHWTIKAQNNTGIYFYTNNSNQKMQILNSGNVSIGNTNDTYKLDVSGTTRITGNATFDSSVDIGGTLNVAGAIRHIGDTSTSISLETSQMTLSTSGGTSISLNNNESLYFYTGASSTQALQLDTSQNATFAGSVTVAGDNITTGTAGTAFSAEKSFTFNFTGSEGGQAGLCPSHQKVQIYLPASAAFWGACEVSVTSSYWYANAPGLVTKSFGIGLYNGSIYTQDYRYSEVLGLTADHFAIGNWSYDGTNSRYYLPIAHRTTSQNTCTVVVRWVGSSTGDTTTMKNMSHSSVYTTDTTVYAKPAVTFGASTTGGGTITSGGITATGNSAVVGDIRITGDITEGATTGALFMYGGAGAKTTPTYSFYGDTNTGMYRTGADNLAFATNSIMRLDINSAGKATFAGDISVAGVSTLTGNATFTNRLQIIKSADSTNLASSDMCLQVGGLGASGKYNAIGFGYNGGTNVAAIMAYKSTSGAGATRGELGFYTRSVTTDTAPTQRMVIDTSGKVGIGTDSPSAFLAGANKVLQVDGEIVITGTNSSKMAIGEAGNSLSYVWQHANLPMLFGTNNTERMRILANGSTTFAGVNTISRDSGAYNASHIDNNASLVLTNDQDTDGEGVGISFHLHNTDPKLKGCAIVAERENSGASDLRFITTRASVAYESMKLSNAQALFTGDVQCGETFKSSDGTSGMTTTKTWVDGDSDTHNVTIKDGLITGWTIS